MCLILGKDRVRWKGVDVFGRWLDEVYILVSVSEYILALEIPPKNRSKGWRFSCLGSDPKLCPKGYS